MSACVIFGGAGYVGTHLAKLFLNTQRFQTIHIADLHPSPLAGTPGITTSLTDVRQPIPTDLFSEKPEWIFNLAAVHREPGHQDHEYFETNLKGAQHICAYAHEVDAAAIYFTSSIAVYGPAKVPITEDRLPMPASAYGSSKYPAELMHQVWQAGKAGRRVIISRPGVIYGPGDPGNIMRMIKAIRKGYFAFPGSKSIHKSYAYVYGFLESVEFMMDRNEGVILYNYVETPTESIDQITKKVKVHFNSKAPILSLPSTLLLPISMGLQFIAGEKNPIHPVRVRKAGTPTYIVPQTLLSMGFRFNYDFASSIAHWHSVAPEDFE